MTRFAMVGLAAMLFVLPKSWRHQFFRLGTFRRSANRTTAQAEARLLRAIAGDLAVGMSTRHAIERAAAMTPTLDLDAPLRRVGAGAGFGTLGPALAPQLPVSGDLLAVVLPMAAESGAGLVAVLDRLADRADSVATAQRERRIATAQARLSAMVIGGLPLAGLLLLVGSGSVTEFDPLTRRVVGVAVALLLFGLGAMAWMVRR